MEDNLKTSRIDMVFKLIQTTDRYIHDILKEQSGINSNISMLRKDVEAIKDNQEEMKKSMRTPDKCSIEHSKLKKQIFTELKTGAKGWARTALVILRVAMYLGLTAGGSALGAEYLVKLLN